MRVEVEVAFSFKRELDERYRSLDLPDGCDVERAIRAWVGEHPQAEGRLFDAMSGIRRHINVLINGENAVFRQGFRTVLENGDRLTILPPAGSG